MKKLVIAEKPSVAKDIAKVLGCKTKGEGYLEGNGYMISWAIGHLVTLYEPEDYDPKNKLWTMKTLPILPAEMKLKPMPNTYKQYNILKKLMNDGKVESIICATDAGREGELIFRYIYNLCQCKKPVQRLWISSLTDEAILEGFRSLKDHTVYDNLYYSAKSRSESDWLVGMNATRAYTIKYKNLLTIGRVQTPTLAFIVNREKEILQFKPEDYWEIKCSFGDYQGTWFDKDSGETKINTEAAALEIRDKVHGQEGIIQSIETKKVVKKPMLLYDLTELQRDANKRYGYTADKTLKIAQELYEKRKAITYPRTDSRYLSKDMIDGLKKKISLLKEHQKYGKYCEYLLSLEKLPISKRVVDDTKVRDHHAIIPTDKKTDIQKLTTEEKNIFDLIVMRFLSAFYPDYIYNSITIITEVKDERFKTMGQQILQLGWRELVQGDDEKEAIVPAVKKGQKVRVNGVEVEKKQTQPPKRYQESSLLAAMENAGKFVDDEELREQLKEGGIGTPATRAAIIERLIQVGYMYREGKNLVPTDKGIKLIELVPAELSSPELTGKWEKALNHIAQGKASYERFMEGIRNFTIFLVKDANERTTALHFPKEKKGREKQEKNTVEKQSLGSCPVCKKGEITKNTKGYGCSHWKEGCKFFIGNICGKSISETQVKKIIAYGKSDVLKGFKSKKGTSFQARLVLKDGKIEFDFGNE